MVLEQARSDWQPTSYLDDSILGPLSAHPESFWLAATRIRVLSQPTRLPRGRRPSAAIAEAGDSLRVQPKVDTYSDRP